MLPMPSPYDLTPENTSVDRVALLAMIDTGLKPADISIWLQGRGLDADSINKVINDLPSYNR